MIVYQLGLKSKLRLMCEGELITNIYENLPNNTSFPAAGFDGILRASSSEASGYSSTCKKD